VESQKGRRGVLNKGFSFCAEFTPLFMRNIFKEYLTMKNAYIVCGHWKSYLYDDVQDYEWSIATFNSKRAAKRYIKKLPKIFEADNRRLDEFKKLDNIRKLTSDELEECGDIIYTRWSLYHFIYGLKFTTFYILKLGF
jgi:hypothetical protein